MSAVLGRCMPWLVYPATVSLGLMFHARLSQAGHPVFVSAYTPVLIAALVLTLLEIYLPNEDRWKPGRFEAGQDALYMLLVQMLLPRVLAFAVAVTAADRSGYQLSGRCQPLVFPETPVDPE